MTTKRSITGVVKAMPRSRYYLLMVGNDYVRRFRPGELTEPGELFHIHAAYPDAMRFEYLTQAEEHLEALLDQLRTVPGYADCAGVPVVIEQHEVCVISTATV